MNIVDKRRVKAPATVQDVPVLGGFRLRNGLDYVKLHPGCIEVEPGKTTALVVSPEYAGRVAIVVESEAITSAFEVEVTLG